MKRQSTTQFNKQMAARKIEQLKRANKKLDDAIEVAVVRGMGEFELPEVAIRLMLAELIKNNLFVPVKEEQVPAVPAQQASRRDIVPDGNAPAKVFDRSAWSIGVDRAAGKDQSKIMLVAGSGGNTERMNNAPPVLEGAAGFDRGAFCATTKNPIVAKADDTRE